MDYIVEIVALGIDSLVLITSLRQYYKKSSSVSMISVSIKKVNSESKFPLLDGLSSKYVPNAY